jgi:hypothetical protein
LRKQHMNSIGLMAAALAILATTAAAATQHTAPDRQPGSAVPPVELRPSLQEQRGAAAENLEAPKEVRAVRVILPSPYRR